MNLTQIALSGISSANQNLSNTSNNIANSETVAFKSTSLTFNQMVVKSGSNSQGIGVTNGAVSTNFANGSMKSTGNPLDHVISGAGFFVVKDTNGTEMLTRTGNFNFDKDGFLVDQGGNHVQGYPSNSNKLTDIKLDKSPLPPVATDKANIVANLGSDIKGSDKLTSSVSVYDSLGTEHSMSVEFGNRILNPTTNESTWDIEAQINGESIIVGKVSFDKSGQLKNGEGAVDANGNILIDLATLTKKLPGVGKIEVDLKGSTGYDGDSATKSQTSNGMTYSELDGYKVEANGLIVFSYQGGETKEIAQIGMANVQNYDGLVAENNGYYSRTTTAGDISYGVSGDSGFGMLYSGYLEGANVDLTSELVDLIASQQFYQANSKVIGVSKELSQALMQVV